MLEELINRLPHAGPIFCDDNKTVFMMITNTISGTSVDSTIKPYSRRKDGRAVSIALIANHAGDTKYLDIVKYRSNLLQNINWNRSNYPLEQHVYNHLTTINNIHDCATHIGNAVPKTPQRVEILLEYITSQDNTLQSSMRNILANMNGIRSDFEGA